MIKNTQKVTFCLFCGAWGRHDAPQINAQM